MKQKVLVAMSGGVDSSVAAYLLKNEGHEVAGATIRTWAGGQCAERNTKACCGVAGVEDARSVAWKLKIPYYVFNFEREFKEHVVDYFSSEYLKGRTPNPCVACNQHIKFALFLERARALGYDAIATGHYAELERSEVSGCVSVCEGKDPAKDQSYVLFPLSQDVLQHLHLPVGGFTKSEIRAQAAKIGLRVAGKPDSQEICFIPSNDYGAFLKRELEQAPQPGPIKDRSGKVLGAHAGYFHFTVGQRKGLGIPYRHAFYVTAIRPSENTVVVGTKAEAAGRHCRVENINWFFPMNGTGTRRVYAKIRSRHVKARAVLKRRSADSAEVIFDEPQDAVTPGQACVFYDGRTVLGGGWIAGEREA